MMNAMVFQKQGIHHCMVKNITYCVLATMLIVSLSGCFNKKKNAQPTQKKPVVELPAGDNVLVLETKQKGGVVVIDAVRLALPGFIVIRDDLYGKPGVVIGVSPLLSVGEAKDIKLDILRDFTGTEQMYAELHADNGDRRFRQTDDTLVANEQKQAVVVPFSLEGTKEPSVDVKY